MPSWDAELVHRVGRRIKVLRGSRSAQWLSEETDRLGFRISPSVIAKLDSGHRGGVLHVSELLVLAAALEVPPVWLLLDDLPDGRFEVLPGVVVSQAHSLEWFAGEDPRADIGDRGPGQLWWDSATELGLVREYRRLLDVLGDAGSKLIAANALAEHRGRPVPPELEAARAQAVKAVERVVSAMRARGMTVEWPDTQGWSGSVPVDEGGTVADG